MSDDGDVLGRVRDPLLRGGAGGGSGAALGAGDPRVQATGSQAVEGGGEDAGGGAMLIERLVDDTGTCVPLRFEWGVLWRYAGPGLLMCIAFVDPGNFESDLQAGALYGYSLLWVLLWATAGGALIQGLATALGVVTQRHLAELCRTEYPGRGTRWAMWAAAELAIVASDIPEVIGTAIALQMLTGLRLWAGVLVTSLSTMGFLMIQHLGARRLEGFIGALVAVMGVSFVVETVWSGIDGGETVRGLVVPEVRSGHALYIGISLLGAIVMPHNLYLHSALVLSRDVPRKVSSCAEACFYNRIESALALGVTLFINVAVSAVAAQLCLDHAGVELCQKDTVVGLSTAPRLLRFLGGSASTVFAVALLASGQSSTMTGTYAGQFVMEGFLDLKVKRLWLRNLVTRLAAIVPSLCVAVLAGERGAQDLIVASSVALSFQLPFALVPLLKFTSSPKVMGPHLVTGKWTQRGGIALSVSVLVANFVVVATTARDQATRWGLWENPALAGVTIAALVAGGVAYYGAVAYLAWKPVTHLAMGPCAGEGSAEADDALRRWTLSDAGDCSDLGASRRTSASDLTVIVHDDGEYPAEAEE